MRSGASNCGEWRCGTCSWPCVGRDEHQIHRAQRKTGVEGPLRRPGRRAAAYLSVCRTCNEQPEQRHAQHVAQHLRIGGGEVGVGADQVQTSLGASDGGENLFGGGREPGTRQRGGGEQWQRVRERLRLSHAGLPRRGERASARRAARRRHHIGCRGGARPSGGRPPRFCKDGRLHRRME